MVNVSTLAKDTYNAIYDLVKNNITDTQVPARPTSQWIFSSFPLNKGINASDYPIIIVNPATVNITTTGARMHQINLQIIVEVFMSGDKAGYYADQLIDQITNIYISKQFTSLRNTYDFYFTEFSTDSNVLQHDSIKVQYRSGTFSLTTIHKVS